MASSKLNNQCKLCRLIKENEELWIGVHNKVIKEGLSHSVVCKWLNGQVDLFNHNNDVDIKRFNQANFTKHFKNHISDVDNMSVELNKVVMSRSDKGSIAFSEREESVANSVVSSDSNDESDHAVLNDMIELMRFNLVSYSEYIKNNRSKSKHVNIKEIENYSKLVSDFISAKQSVIKLKNSDQQSSMAVKLAIELVVKGLASKIIGVADEVKESLEMEIEQSESTIPEQISRLIKSRLSSGMRDLVSDTTDKVHKNFGIK